MSERDFPRHISYMMIFITAVILFVVLKATAQVVIPVVIAIILSFIMLPVVRAMRKIRIPWILGVIIVTTLVIICIVVIGTLLIASLKTIIEQQSKYVEKLSAIYEAIPLNFNFQFDADKSFFKNMQMAFDGLFDLGQVLSRAMLSFSTNMLSFFRVTLTIILMFIFLLIEVDTTSEKLKEAFEGKLKTRMPIIAKQIMFQVMRFLSIKFFFSLVTGILVYASAKIIHLDFAIVWAFIAFVLNFIPNFGSIFSVGVTTLFALLQFYPTSRWQIIFIFIMMLCINMILGNFIEPRIAGNNLGISPFVILIMLSLWGWMWGFVGMILAVPLTVILKIICENVSLLHPVAILLGNKVQDTRKEFPEDEIHV
ncbi:MAG: AI-2E family transporter [Treponema sp.]|nr:AI-2E family transporter [Treponema sp.]